jgi:two-component system heavy metal sensor histidine kinase CusS
MFLKRVKQLFSNTGSIATQLTFFYSLSTFTLIAIASLFYYWAMITILSGADEQFVNDEINIVKNILMTKSNNFSALRQEVTDIPNALNTSVYHYYIRISDSQKNTLVKTEGMNTFIATNKKNYLIKQMRIPVQKQNSPWLIQVALDISYQNKIIDQYQKNVFLVLIAGAIFSIIFGYFISRKGMKRLYELTAVTQKITANTLQKRVDLTTFPQELNMLGEAYNQMLDRIEYSLSRLTQFSDDLAHELRIPINNLMGQTEVALSRDTTLEEYQTLCESNLEELNRLAQIIENLLFLARTENPQLDCPKTLLNAAEEMNMLCDFYQAFADEKSIILSVTGQGTLFANAIMFRRMISNVLSNALNYAHKKSTVLITIKETENNIEIMIADQGIGIAEEHLAKIFTRFYRADTARSNHFGSTGLGLSIVKSIVDLHGGNICIKSKLNEGTAVIISFPRATTPPHQAESILTR